MWHVFINNPCNYTLTEAMPEKDAVSWNIVALKKEYGRAELYSVISEMMHQYVWKKQCLWALFSPFFSFDGFQLRARENIYFLKVIGSLKQPINSAKVRTPHIILWSLSSITFLSRSNVQMPCIIFLHIYYKFL